MIKKKCNCCNKRLHIDFFIVGSMKNEKEFNICSVCRRKTRINSKKEIFNNFVKDLKKEINKEQKIVNKHNEFIKNNKPVDVYNGTYRKFKDSKTEYIKDWCRNNINARIRQGNIIKPKICPCCNKNKDIVCHHVDYSKPFYIVWCCHKCHAKFHTRNIDTKLKELKRKLRILLINQ